MECLKVADRLYNHYQKKFQKDEPMEIADQFYQKVIKVGTFRVGILFLPIRKARKSYLKQDYFKNNTPISNQQRIKNLEERFFFFIKPLFKTFVL